MQTIFSALKRLDGSSFSMGGPIVLLHFWRPTCVECISDIQFIKSLVASLGLEVVGVVAPRFRFDISNETINRFVERLGIGYKIAFADKAFFEWFRINECHEFVVANAEGEVLYIQLGGGGYYWLKSALRDKAGVNLDDSIKTLLEDFETADSLSLLNADWYAANRPWRSFRIDGDYEITQDAVYATKARIVFDYRGRRLYAVVEPAVKDSTIRVRLNEHPLRSHLMGDDVIKIGSQSFIKLDTARLYSVVDGGWGEYRLSLDVEQPCHLYALVAR